VRAHPALEAIRVGTIADWTLESHDLARDLVYRHLSPWLFITEGYVDRAMPASEEQLMRAGVRLARVLNETLSRER
jgi:hypothetical protein